MGVQPRLIDSHCHLDDDRFSDDRNAVLERADNAGVQKIIIPAIKRAWWPKVKKTSAGHGGLHACYGLHPAFIAEHQQQDLTDLKIWIENEKPAAIGECGLDYSIEEKQTERQLEFFEAQLAIALEYDLPLVIHARQAVEDTIISIRRYLGVRGVLHSFSGSEQQAKRLIEMGFMLGFGGPATYPRARRLQRLIKQLPLDAILLESDAPDQPGIEHKGNRNEPGFLPEIATCFSSLRNQPVATIAHQTNQNCQRLFRL